MAKKKCDYPKAIIDLARSRVKYEGGRFLVGDIIMLPRKTKDDIDKWIVQTGHPLGFEAGTQERRIAKLAKEAQKKCKL